MRRIDIGRLTQEETLELVVEALGMLTEEQRNEALTRALTRAERAELAAVWSEEQ